jgi:hypothetical protein
MTAAAVPLIVRSNIAITTVLLFKYIISLFIQGSARVKAGSR